MSRPACPRCGAGGHDDGKPIPGNSWECPECGYRFATPVDLPGGLVHVPTTASVEGEYVNPVCSDERYTTGDYQDGKPLPGFGPQRRLRECVERWPECEEGKYDPRCCRFPKSCSCTVYDEERVAESDLEVLGCPTFLSPGPPFYAARCRLPSGHEGDCDFPTADEARAAFLQTIRGDEAKPGVEMAMEMYPPRRSAQSAADEWSAARRYWMLVERYCERYPDDWRLVFRRDGEILEVQVPEDVWRAFDGHDVEVSRG